jgi:hypothetical protein
MSRIIGKYFFGFYSEELWITKIKLPIIFI